MTITVPATYDGASLKLAGPIDLPAQTPVWVTVCTDDEREVWLKAGDEHFVSAFGEDEPEYTLRDIIE